MIKRWWIWSSLIFFDILATLVAFSLAYWIRIHSGLIPYRAVVYLQNYLRLYLYSIPFLLLIFYRAHLYDRHELFYGTGEYIQIIKGCAFYILGVILISFGFHGPSPSRGWLLITLALSIGAISSERFIFRRVIKRIWKKGNYLERILILGASDGARALAEQLEQSGMAKIVGFLDEFTHQGETVWKDRCVLGSPSMYCDIAQREGVGLVILVPEATSWETQREVLRHAFSHHEVEVQIAPGFNELYLASMRISFKGNVSLLRFSPGYITGLDAILKVVMDYTLGLGLLVITAPAMIIFSLILLIQKTRPVMVGFEVLGKNARPFRMYKFGTGINVPTNYRSFHKRGKHDPDMVKMASMARFLQYTALDKLPQLFNVLLGRMSLVGPRIVPIHSTRQYGPWLLGVLAVKPGMTGTWAFQESGNLEQEISSSIYYVRNWNIWKDLAILGQSILAVIRTLFRNEGMAIIKLTKMDSVKQ